jgi:hypothetical protein
MINQQPRTARQRSEQFAARHGLVIHRKPALATYDLTFSKDGVMIDRATKYDTLLRLMEKFVNESP